MRFKADRSKISYRHCDSGDLLQMATVESRGRKRSRGKETREVKQRENIGVISAQTLHQRKDISQVLEGIDRIE